MTTPTKKDLETEEAIMVKYYTEIGEGGSISPLIALAIAEEREACAKVLGKIRAIADKPYDFSGKTDMWQVAQNLSDDTEDIKDIIDKQKEA